MEWRGETEMSRTRIAHLNSIGTSGVYIFEYLAPIVHEIKSR